MHAICLSLRSAFSLTRIQSHLRPWVCDVLRALCPLQHGADGCSVLPGQVQQAAYTKRPQRLCAAHRAVSRQHVTLTGDRTG